MTRGQAPIFWIPVGFYNPLLAFILALFFALAVRFFILLFLEANSRASATLFRLLTGTVSLVLSSMYFLFVTPLLIWDHTARVVAAITFGGVLLWTTLRHSKGRAISSSGVLERLIYVVLFAVFILAAILTIIRTGYIALTGDRVTLIVDVTGETRNQTVSWTTPRGPAGEKSIAAHHIIFWLPTGVAAAEMWIYGDEMAVHGKAIRFSRFLNGIGIPNLYALQYVHNGYLSPERQDTYPPAAIPFPGTGALAVHPKWHPVQDHLLNFWATLAASGSWWAIQIADNESAYYPLIDPDGKPIHKNFLLVLKPTGIASTKGSSPLENKRSATR